MKRCSTKYAYRSMVNVVEVHDPGKKPKKEYRDDPADDGQKIATELIVFPACRRSPVSR